MGCRRRGPLRHQVSPFAGGAEAGKRFVDALDLHPVGLEHIDDILADLEAGFRAAKSA